MTAAERVSCIGNRTDAYRILSEKPEDGDYFGHYSGDYFGDHFGDYFGNPGLDGSFKMDVGEIHCEAAEWTELSRVMAVPSSCESVYKSLGSQMTVRF
jgi:hypothetical protein